MARPLRGACTSRQGPSALLHWRRPSISPLQRRPKKSRKKLTSIRWQRLAEFYSLRWRHASSVAQALASSRKVIDQSFSRQAVLQ